jgi:hypothetical protein
MANKLVEYVAPEVAQILSKDSRVGLEQLENYLYDESGEYTLALLFRDLKLELNYHQKKIIIRKISDSFVLADLIELKRQVK